MCVWNDQVQQPGQREGRNDTEKAKMPIRSAASGYEQALDTAI
jgi:hypothetical protein